MSTEYEIVMGLETHVRIKSNTKMFCACQNALELAPEANINVCPVCMGFPGMLPTVSSGVIDLAVRASHALRSVVQETSIFDRKSYFYPDLPMGYQITQLYQPIAMGGEVRAMIDGELRVFRIHHMHIENDAGKLVHAGGKTLCDYNRAGSPLMEIVTEPDFRSKADVLGYLEELQKLMRWCGASDADMEKGQLRCDVNISVRVKGETALRNRVELKNVNGFASIGRAIDVEFARQIEIYEAGGQIDQETRGWSDEKGFSTPMRSKEDAMDYRYFPDPDLPPLVLTPEFITDREIAELPMDRRVKYLNEYNLAGDDARILSNERELSDFYEEVSRECNDYKKACSYITTVLFPLWIQGLCNLAPKTKNIENPFPDAGKKLGEIIKSINEGSLSSTGAKKLIEYLSGIKNKKEDGTLMDWFEVAEKLDINFNIDYLEIRQKNDLSALEAIVDLVIAESPGQLAEYKAGKVNLFGFFVGQSMKKSAGQGNPKIFTEILNKKLSN